MASNIFGNILKIITWGESHGEYLGVVIDGYPSGISIDHKYINDFVSLRSPGSSYGSTTRKEPDNIKIVSGIFEGITTGCPISVIIKNKKHNSEDYSKIKNICRPSHADFSYLNKYGIYDYRGGGRASARETACRSIAGAFAKKLLEPFCIRIENKITSLGEHKVSKEEDLKKIIDEAIKTGDTLGGIVSTTIKNVPLGWGDPVYEKLNANIAKYIMSIPSVKGIEIGSGFNVTNSSKQNDSFIYDKTIKPKTNNAGGILGGISTGTDINLKTSFKPTPTNSITQKTVDNNGNQIELNCSNMRYDISPTIRGKFVIEAMLYILLSDAYLLNKIYQT